MLRFHTLTFIAAAFGPTAVFGLTGIPATELSQCDTLVTDFMSTYEIPGASVAISKDGKLIYSRGFGYSDLERTVPTQPHHLFRIASLSKPITSIAIMTLAESDQLKLDDKVFGPDGILSTSEYFNSATVTDGRIAQITAQHHHVLRRVHRHFM